jgi:hypothetical protein
MRTLTWLTTIALALAPGLASADHQNTYYPQYARPELAPRYQQQNKLAEVSADPRDGSDRIQLPPGQFAYLELRAREAPIVLRDFIVRFADGRMIRTGSRGTIVPGQGRVVNLPQTGAPIVEVIAEYGQPYGAYGAYGSYGAYRHAAWNDRTPARLEIFGVPQDCEHDRPTPGWYR